MLGVQPFLGRGFSIEEEKPGQDQAALISYALWQRRFGGVRETLGKKITINGTQRIVIGVLPEGFHFPRATETPQAYDFPEKTDLWTPLAKDAGYWSNRSQRQWVPIIGRLKAGVTQTQG